MRELRRSYCSLEVKNTFEYLNLICLIYITRFKHDCTEIIIVSMRTLKQLTNHREKRELPTFWIKLLNSLISMDEITHLAANHLILIPLIIQQFINRDIICNILMVFTFYLPHQSPVPQHHLSHHHLNRHWRSQS